jgi:hypothetical protein
VIGSSFIPDGNSDGNCEPVENYTIVMRLPKTKLSVVSNLKNKVIDNSVKI